MKNPPKIYNAMTDVREWLDILFKMFQFVKKTILSMSYRCALHNFGLYSDPKEKTPSDDQFSSIGALPLPHNRPVTEARL